MSTTYRPNPPGSYRAVDPRGQLVAAGDYGPMTHALGQLRWLRQQGCKAAYIERADGQAVGCLGCGMTEAEKTSIEDRLSEAGDSSALQEFDEDHRSHSAPL